MKTFFRFAIERGWVSGSTRSDSPQTMPLIGPEMWALLAACARQPKERALILLVRCSGLAIGDAVTSSREAVVGTELTLRRTKFGEVGDGEAAADPHPGPIWSGCAVGPDDQLGDIAHFRI